ncbi:snaclec agkisacutacin subunit A-like [Asterias amurensis]|uniref:snaclec agkisacutacin subunit A-like n=1 Tax=Asterias amurensis TaxID=7602 RepID=UPI003AB127CA
MLSFAAWAGIISLCFSILSGIQAICPSGWLTWQNSCYILLPQKMTWFDAKMVCDRPGSSMIVPNTHSEHDFIWHELGANKGDNLGLWIGCRRVQEADTVCSDNNNNNNLQFKNWAQGQPDKGNEECIRMAHTFGGKWGDSNCTLDKFAACEMSVPEPEYCLTAEDYGRFTPQCLLNHDIKNLTANGVIGCGQACWAEPRCHSFNLWQKGKICQLNNASRLQADVADIKIIEGCSFFEL